MKALIIGSTGLIGNELLNILENDNYFDKIELWVRKYTNGNNSNKINTRIIDFNKISEIEKIEADVVFCCVGTTIKKAKTKEAFRKVDFDIPIDIAMLSEKSKIKKLIIISSLGAEKESKNFYLKTKGEMEFAVSQLNILSIILIRPSMLLGNRNEFRFGEIIGKNIMQILSFLFFGKFRKYKAIHAKTVALAMIKAAKTNFSGIKVFESDEIEKIAGN
jgi:uncharacterized protein YbjT (DUF2867 family)